MRTREPPPFRRWAPRCHVISHKSRHIMCLYVASSPPHKRISGLITLQIVWFSYMRRYKFVYIVFLVV